MEARLDVVSKMAALPLQQMYVQLLALVYVFGEALKGYGGSVDAEVPRQVSDMACQMER